jgi:hypothetical protein
MADTRTMPEIMGYEYAVDQSALTVRVRKVRIEHAGDGVPAGEDVAVWEASGREWPASPGMGYGVTIGDALADLFRNRRDQDDLRLLRHGDL